MKCEQKNAYRGAIPLSLGFYLGLGTLLLLLVAGAVVFPAPSPLIDQHANPVPASRLPAEVLTSPHSNLYHAGAACSYAHRDSKLLATPEAVHQGLIPCPYCIGNSSARLTRQWSRGELVRKSSGAALRKD
jgi:hypothetical protein